MASARQKAVNRADKYFSLYIRQREADARGYNSCKTCGREAHYKQLQCGHFQSRKFYATRWDELNAACQCGRCNMLSGEQYLMGQWLNKTFGEGTAEQMYTKAHIPTKLTTKEIEEIADKFKELCKD